MTAAKVFSDSELVLEVSDGPGVLLSTAVPPPGGAPEHPFVNARAFDPFSEGDLAAILGVSESYQDFLVRLADAGYLVEPQDQDQPPA